MSIALSLAIMVVILCSLYLYDDYRKKHLKAEDSKIHYNNLIPILKYGFWGGLASFLLFIIIQNLSAGTDEQSFIFIGVVVISSIICACAAWIVQTLKGFNSKEDKGD